LNVRDKFSVLVIRSERGSKLYITEDFLKSCINTLPIF
jgi:hypothetical protein